MEPISTALMVVQGIKLAVTGIKEAAELAKSAFNEVQECVDSGKDLAESMGSITKFFTAAGKYEQHRNDLETAKQAQEEAAEKGEPVPDAMSDAEYVLEMMAVDRQIKQYYEYIKDYLTYNFSEPGLWAEFNTRLNNLRREREQKAETKRRQETERLLAIKAAAMREKRKRHERIQSIQTSLAVIVIVGVILGFTYAIWWMFQQQGKL